MSADGTPLLARNDQKSSNSDTIANIFKCVTGTGILALPYSLALGRLSSVIMLICCGLLCTYTALKLCDATKKGPPFKDFGELGHEAGPVAANAMLFVQCLELAGVTVIFLVLCASSAIALPCFADVPNYVAIVASGILATSIVYLCPNMSKVAWVASLGVINIGFTFVIILIEAITHREDWYSNTMELFQWPTLQDLLVAMGCVLFTFTAHGNFPIFVHSMKNPENAHKCFLLAFAASIVFQVSFAIMGFAAYGVSVNQAINNSVRSSTLRGALSCSIFWDKMLTYPVVFIPLERNIAKILGAQTRYVRPIAAISFVLIAVLCGDNFATVISLVGNVSASLNAFVFPVVFVVLLVPFTIRRECLLLAVCVVIGLAAVLGGTTADVMNMINARASATSHVNINASATLHVNTRAPPQLYT